jgi:serine protease Do
VGDTVNVTVLRDGKIQTLKLVLGERPASKAQDQQPSIGISGVDVSPEIASIMNLNQSKGVLVVGVVADSPADKGGLRGGYVIREINGTEIELGGDVIISADGKPVSNISELTNYIQSKSVGDKVTLGIIRDGQPKEITLTLAPKPRITQ